MVTAYDVAQLLGEWVEGLPVSICFPGALVGDVLFHELAGVFI